MEKFLENFDKFIEVVELSICWVLRIMYLVVDGAKAVWQHPLKKVIWLAFGEKITNILRNAAAIAIVVAVGYVGWLLYDGIQNPLYLEFSGYKGVSVSKVAEEYIGDQYDKFSSCVIYSRATEKIVKTLKTDNKFVCRGEYDDDKTVIWEDEMIVPSKVTVEDIFGREVEIKCMLRDRK